MRNLLFFLLSISLFAGFVFVFRTPTRDVYIITKKSPKQSHSQISTVSAKDPIPSQKQQLQIALRKLAQSDRSFTKKKKIFGRLPSGQWMIGFPDGFGSYKAHKHRPKGYRILLLNQKGEWSVFLKGKSVYRVRSSRTGWTAILTVNDHLILRRPDGRTMTLDERTGGQPQFSPSGQHLVHVHRQSIAHHTLLWRNLQSGKEHALASRGPISDPVVSPDEKSVIFASGITGIVSFWRATLSGKLTQLTNRGLTPGQGRPPKGFVPPPTGRFPAIWAGSWLVYDAGEALWAIRTQGSPEGIKIADGTHVPKWQIPGRSVLYTQNKQRMVYNLPK